MVSLVPSEFARSGRIWQGKLPLSSFSRLSEVLDAADEEVSVRLEFSLDANGRVQVCGQVDASAELMCYTCMKSRPCMISAAVDMRIVQTEREAKEFFTDFDAVVLEEGPITVQELIEDDVLLSIPSSACAEGDDCIHRPRLLEGQATQSSLPFRDLGRALKSLDNT